MFALLALPARAQTWAVEECTEESLREGIDAALNLGWTLQLPDCDITITNPIVIEEGIVLSITGGGAGSSSIGGGGRVRIFEVKPGAWLTVSGATLSNGSNDFGGAVYIHAGAEAVFRNCVFSDNLAAGANGTNGYRGADYSGIGGNGRPGGYGKPAYGGGVYNLGTVTFEECDFSGNQAIGGRGGKGGDGGTGGFAGGNGGLGGNGGTGRGGAIYNGTTGIASISDGQLESNTAEGGNGGEGGAAGVGPQPGAAGYGGNGARGAGAGIYNEGFIELSGLTLLQNEGSGGNTAAAGTLNGGPTGGDGAPGGGAFGGGLCSLGEAFAVNCTFALNRAFGGKGGDGGDGSVEAGDGGDGGEAYGGAVYSSASQWLMNCTMATNGVTGGTNGVAGEGPVSGKNGKKGVVGGASIFGASPGELHYMNSIFAYPTGSTNGTGRLYSEGHNISTDASVPNGPNGYKGAPLLLPLADNGGRTLTMLPGAGSPAANRGGVAAEGAHIQTPDLDQRGMGRPGGDDFDIGAVEAQLPEIVEEPESLEIYAGSAATFRVGVEGDGPFSYQWLRNGTNIAAATRSTYTTTSTNVGDIGFSVIVTNVAGAVTSGAAVLTVVPVTAAFITMQPESQAAPQGANVTFRVAASGSLPMFVQWRSNNVAIARATNWSLVLQNVRSNFSAGYSAVVTNFGGSVTSLVATLTVAEGAPYITRQPTNVVTSTGANVTFLLSASGFAPLAIQWRSNNIPIPLETNFSLTLASVTPAFSADYSARVTNAIGGVLSDFANLRVVDSPAISSGTVSTTNFALVFQTATGLVYVTEYKTSLVAAAWIPLKTNVGTGLSVTNLDAINAARRFYRVRAQ